MKSEQIEAIRARIEAYDQTRQPGYAATERGYFRHVAAMSDMKTHAADDIRALLDTAQALLPALEALMGSISERERYAGWTLGLEYVLWEAIHEGVKPTWHLTDEEIAALRALSVLMGGWAMWGAVEDRPVFVSLNEWQKYLESPGL
jgi:hypothetical protein